MGLSILTLSLHAQRIKVTEGDIKALKNEASINIEFTYNDMRVGKFKTEADYVAKKTEEYNKKEAGKGDTWANSWVNDREERYEPKFVELFTDNSNMKEDKNATYTLVFNTSFTEPGFNIGVMRQNAYIDGEVTMVETKNRTNVIAKLTVSKAPGRDVMGVDFDTGWRISEAYAKAGKSLGKYIK
ncbi:MAG: hypothetical protein IPH58_10235 [Sphingobacteriales bacterium]|nr:hypothetical protein [Sphingobacteriales bacterium]